MKAVARQRSHSIEFKRQVAQEFIAGESTRAFLLSISPLHQERISLRIFSPVLSMRREA